MTRRSSVRPSCAAALAAFAWLASPPVCGAQPTFARDIAPIIRAHCIECHQSGGDAPFSLDSFADVRARATAVVDAVSRRYMPPWKPSRDEGGPFLNARGLDEESIELIDRWVQAGAPEGVAAPQGAGAPNARARSAHVPAASEWRLGSPDLVLSLSEPFVLDADGADVFRTFVLPIPVAAEKFVAGIEFKPGGPAVHHANLRVDRTDGSRELDAADPRPGYEGPLSMSARYPDGYFLGWTPGQLPPLAAPGLAWRLAPSTDLVVQLHLRKTGKPEPVRPSIALYFTDDPPVRPPTAIRLGRQNIDIPAGERYTVRDRYRLPVGVDVHAVHPHAHYRATRVMVWAELPDGHRHTLLRIDDWDFNWQDVYRFATPVGLPPGTLLEMAFDYDNSDANPRNPDRPPRHVTFGQNSSDEMGDVWLQVMTHTDGDRAILANDLQPKALTEDAVGYQMLLAALPVDAAPATRAGLHSDLALIYARLDRLYDAVSQFERAIQLNPSAPGPYYNLGTLLASVGRLEDAAARFRGAIAQRPTHAPSHNNLGVVLRSLGRLGEARDSFRRAVALDPTNAEARANLSVLEAPH